jgi:hypothetical protein
MQHRVLRQRLKHDLVEVRGGEEANAMLLGPINHARQMVGHRVGAIRRAGGRSHRRKDFDRRDGRARCDDESVEPWELGLPRNPQPSPGGDGGRDYQTPKCPDGPAAERRNGTQGFGPEDQRRAREHDEHQKDVSKPRWVKVLEFPCGHAGY